MMPKDASLSDGCTPNRNIIIPVWAQKTAENDNVLCIHMIHIYNMYVSVLNHENSWISFFKRIIDIYKCFANATHT